MLKKWVFLATLIFCCIFSYQGMGICFSLQYFPVACLTKTRLLLRVTRGCSLLLPLELQQQQTFKIMVSVMTIKLKRLEFKLLWRMSGSETDISVGQGSPAAWAKIRKLQARWSLWVSSNSENSVILILNFPEMLQRSGEPLMLQVILITPCLLQGQANFILHFMFFNLNIGRDDVRVKVSGDCEQHMDHFSW